VNLRWLAYFITLIIFMDFILHRSYIQHFTFEAFVTNVAVLFSLFFAVIRLYFDLFFFLFMNSYFFLFIVRDLSSGCS